MKAKDYAKQFEAASADEKVKIACEIALAFLRETGELIKRRNAKSSPALTAIFEEQNTKWHALCRLQPDILPGGFEAVVKSQTPKLHRAWMANRARR